MKNKKLILILLTILNLIFISVSYADDKKSRKPKSKKINASLLLVEQKLVDLKADEDFYSTSTTIVNRWLPIMTLVREGAILKMTAVDSINKFTNELWEFMESRIKTKRLKKYSDKEWVFPLRGYTSAAIGGTGGSGYISAGFDFFDQNSSGHPAHDIFINDKNQDGIDDNTNLPVDILSMSGGIVVETRKNWTPDMMDIKGGNMVYVYDNFTNGFFYYAHMKEVSVNVGDFVEPGTTLGIVGRTGKNAYPSHSPTHLHIMYVRSFDGNLIPENIYNDLLNAKLAK